MLYSTLNLTEEGKIEMNNVKGFTKIELISVIGIIAVLLACIGWGMNLYKLAEADFEAPYKTEIVRTIGLVPVVGAFTGYMAIGEENNANNK